MLFYLIQKYFINEYLFIVNRIKIIKIPLLYNEKVNYNCILSIKTFFEHKHT
jgi:hypothetical protein